jgi:hypothetical protein
LLGAADMHVHKKVRCSRYSIERSNFIRCDFSLLGCCSLQEDPGQLQHRSDNFRGIDASATGLKVDAATALIFAG